MSQPFLDHISATLDQIRSESFTPPMGGGNRVRILDPFVEAFRPPGATDPDELGIYIKDTQGVVRGAVYAYLLVRFEENGEIDRTIPLGSVTIP